MKIQSGFQTPAKQSVHRRPLQALKPSNNISTLLKYSLLNLRLFEGNYIAGDRRESIDMDQYNICSNYIFKQKNTVF